MADVELSPEVQDILDKLKDVHDQIPNAEAFTKALYDERKALVLRARQTGVSGYRLARFIGVSDTTISNISRDD